MEQTNKELDNEQSSYEGFEKRGQAAGAVGAIITLIVGVGVAVLVLIFVGALGGQTYNIVEDNINEIGGTVVNESFTPLNNTAVNLNNDDLLNGTLSVVNSTDGTIGLGNFTVDYTAGSLTANEYASNFSTLYATYDHGDATIKDSVKSGITSGFGALEQTGDYLPIIVLAVVISLVMFLVLGFTQFGNFGAGGRSAL